MLAVAVAACMGCAAPPDSTVAAAVDVPPAPAAAEAGADYVALGSSFASGPGLPPVVDEGCGRSGANYAHQVADALQLRLTDVSCLGARTENVEYKPQENDRVRPAQLDAVTPDTDLVTLTIGGNDIGYTTALDDHACSARSECPGVSVDEEAVLRGLETIADKLVVTVETIRAAAPQATVLLVTYPQIVPASGTSCAAIALTAEQAAFHATVGARLNTAFHDAARRTGVQLVDSYHAGEGHTACAADDPWVSGYLPFTLGGPAAFHPTASGMHGMAQLVLAALRG